MAGRLDELAAEVAQAAAEVGLVLRRRRGRPDPDRWYAITDGATIVRLLRARPAMGPDLESKSV